MDTDRLLVDRLWDNLYLHHNKDNSFNWNNDPVTFDDIQKAYESNIESLSEAFNKNMAQWSDKTWTNEQHIQRVLYFIKHPEEIKAISIDNLCSGMSIYPIPIIEDGNHRLIAAKFLKLKYIDCSYGGRLDVLAYLKGETDELPEE